MEETIFQERKMPQNNDAEQAVLGSIFLDEDAIVTVMGTLQSQDFYQTKNRIVFDAMAKLHQRGDAIDVVTVINELRATNQLDNIGGPEYLLTLAEIVPTAANVGYYTKIVSDKAILRNLITTANDIAKSGYEESEELSTILDDAERNILTISERRNRTGFVKIGDVVSRAIETVELLAKQTSEVTGLSTGYIDLDRKTTGLHEDELIILAARPAVGKTAFALNIAQNVATKSQAVVAIFSLEMGVESLVNRMLCAEGNIDANHMRTGNLTDVEWDHFFLAVGSLGRSQIYIDDTPGIRVSEIRAKCRRLKQEVGSLGLIVIDYLQLIEGSRRGENRQQEVSEISRQLKKLAKELKVPVIALSQLSRGVEQRQDKRPILSDIRESGSIEQDADIVAFLYREDYYDREGNEQKEDQTENNIVEVIIEKNRSGARGTVKLLFKKEFNKFSSLINVPDYVQS